VQYLGEEIDDPEQEEEVEVDDDVEQIDNAEQNPLEREQLEEEQNVVGEPPQLIFRERNNLTIRFLENRRSNNAEKEFILSLHDHAIEYIEAVLTAYEVARARFNMILFQEFIVDAETNQNSVDLIIQKYSDTLEGMRNEDLQYLRSFEPANGQVYAKAIHGTLVRNVVRPAVLGNIANFPDRVTILFPIFFQGIPIGNIVGLLDNLRVLPINILNKILYRIGIIIHEATHHYAGTHDDTSDTIDNGYYYGSFPILLLHNLSFEEL
jgi:hypothetical protein